MIFSSPFPLSPLIFFEQNYAKTLVNADRASLFLLDPISQELYARIFDTGNIDESDDAGVQCDKEIRFAHSLVIPLLVENYAIVMITLRSKNWLAAHHHIKVYPPLILLENELHHYVLKRASIAPSCCTNHEKRG
jgi:hypothetical protein